MQVAVAWLGGGQRAAPAGCGSSQAKPRTGVQMLTASHALLSPLRSCGQSILVTADSVSSTVSAASIKARCAAEAPGAQG